MVVDSVKDWRDAIEVGTKNLIEQGYITHEYTEAIVQNALEHNAYFVLCPGVALLHATSEKGVNETQLAITYVKEPFQFEGKDEDVNLMITLAAADHESHMGAMQQVAITLSDDATLDHALHPADAADLYDLFTNATL